MTDYVQVPVPAHLVADVMQFIVERSSKGQTASPALEADPAAAGPAIREWTTEQFELLASSEARSVKLFCQVLDILAEAGPAGLPLDEIAFKTGVEGLTMQRTFGRVTAWIRKRGIELRWPIHYPQGNWAMTPTNAAAWKQVRG
ncbi:MAG: hypothetical protein Q4G50_08975 [Corynebacterium sp.]|uniref:hypothetical protein n=1 Tax=Corynebacterium sp. TaxID=1720 RepID=UPI0026E08F14|nr:hypothetical protein [Corynebacterium sp.]MDO5670122.1 hypothetical protein [Corynebacterium sp.]